MIKGMMAVLIMLIGTYSAAGSVVSSASFSPDGSQLVFVGHDTNGREKLFVSNSGGTDERMLMLDVPKKEFSPVWSPDGEKIYFISFNKQGNEKLIEGN
jgi:Tol biopolymer transport system component